MRLDVKRFGEIFKEKEYAKQRWARDTLLTVVLFMGLTSLLVCWLRGCSHEDRQKGPTVTAPIFLFAVFRGSSWEQSGGCGCKFDGDGPGPASLPQLECHLPHHQRGPLWPLHHPDRPCHQRRHGNRREGKWEAKAKTCLSPFKLTKATRIARGLQLFHAFPTWEHECFKRLFTRSLCAGVLNTFGLSCANDSGFLPP